MPIRYDRYYRYADFTAILQQFVQSFPRLVAMQSIGTSHEGRDIWVLTVTNQDTGAAADKPAYSVTPISTQANWLAARRRCT